MIKQIKSEMKKENPNWILISKLAIQIHNDALETNFFKFKKGQLNVIRVSDYNCGDILESLESCLDSDDYRFIQVGGYTGMTVTKYNRLIDGLEVNDKFVIVVTNKDQVVANSLKKGLLINQYSGTIKGKYDRTKEKELVIKNDNFNLKCKLNELKSHVRDLKLEEIGI
jgi:Zn-dependent metalloprotease